ncbi:MAG: cobalt-zinc-cadmium efflux system protein [Betaproteobacteria bacterium]|jgi:cobalt-zinc-cadmium efflux system protein|nr:cobalt-zinc-cadmium efflux system protein [Betaproteobacteria bacterium]
MAEHHHHHGHSHAHQTLSSAAIVTVVFAVAEAFGGWWTGSLALVSDAGHMFTDAGALLLGALAAWMARRPPSQRHSYGLGRAEVVAALVNATVMLAIVVALAYESFLRLKNPSPVNGAGAAVIAAVGLAVNLWVLRRLAPHRHDLNTRAARLHVLGDVLGSVAALVSGAVIAATGWTAVDALASLAICVLIAFSAVRLMRESLHALMEGVPHGLSVESIGAEMARVEGVLSVHDLHVWTLSGSRTALSAHVVVRNLGEWDRTLGDLQLRLQAAFGIDHVTLQPESGVRPLVRHR